MERAILWAMSLHPDERPQTMAQLKDYFTGKTIIREFPSREVDQLQSFMREKDINRLVVGAAVLSILSLILSLVF